MRKWECSEVASSFGCHVQEGNIKAQMWQQWRQLSYDGLPLSCRKVGSVYGQEKGMAKNTSSN